MNQNWLLLGQEKQLTLIAWNLVMKQGLGVARQPTPEIINAGERWSVVGQTECGSDNKVMEYW